MRAISALFVLALVFPMSLRAESTEAPEIATRFDRYIVEYRLNDDASHVESHEWAMTILKERAVEHARQTSITYSTSIQKAEVVAAYTRKADGRRLDAPKTNFQVEVNKGQNKDAPVFSDMTTLTVVFPEVAVGDTVVFVYKITQKEAMFPGQFSMMQVFPRTYAYDEVKIHIDMPTALRAQYAAREMSEKVVEQGGRRIIDWAYSNKQPVKSMRRNWSVYDTEKEPGFSFSTFQSYTDIAAAYGTRALPKAAATERVRKLADEITQGKAGVRDQARALYDWVATNISYAGNCIGVGAVVPHDLAFVLDNRMGDCKDHATLLQALLKAKNIESTQALVNAGGVYRLPQIPVVSSVNHVINYIPSLDLYLDSTAMTTPFGLLPFGVADKHVLLVDGSKPDARTPPWPVGANQQKTKTVVRILPDGSATAEIEVSLKGMFAADARAHLRHMSKEVEEELVKNVLKGSGHIGSGTFEKSDPTALLDTYQYKVRLEMKDLIQRPGAGGFAIVPLFYSEAPISRFTQVVVEPLESVDVACWGGASTEEYRFEFPKDMKILAVPDNLTIKKDALTYHASYLLKGNTLTVKRAIDDRTQGNVCTPQTAATYQTFATKALQNIKAQVVYK